MRLHIRRWASLILNVVVILLLVIPLTGCSKTNDDIVIYLTKMQDWQHKWIDAGITGNQDALLTELQTIEFPSNIPLKFSDVGIIDYWTKSNHDDYVSAHVDYLRDDEHFETMRALEEQRFAALGIDEIPYVLLDESGYYKQPDVSLEFEQAYLIENRAIERLGRAEGHLSLYFGLYLSGK